MSRFTNRQKRNQEVAASAAKPKQPAVQTMRQRQPAIGNQAMGRMLGRRQFIHDTAHQGTTGSGTTLPFLNQIQRAFGRHDVTSISAHQDSRAAKTAQAIGARAYTFGDQIAFGGTPDLRTAAHEAAHVVQQRAGIQLSGGVGKVGDVYERHADAVADQVSRGGSAEGLLNQMAPAGSQVTGAQSAGVQRAAIKTDFGEFDTTKYDSVGASGSEYGVDIDLTFDPDTKKVDAKKIGLTQTVRSQVAGKAVSVYPIHHERKVSSGKGEGSRIDRIALGKYGNPLYATDEPAAGDKLEDTATVASWGQHGWNYDDSGTNKHQKAILKDKPTMPGRGKNSAQKFETVALAVEGKQSGTYMGSVTWGWSVDGSDKFTKDPLTLKTKGAPSAGFVAAAKQWNKTSVGGTIKTNAKPTNVYDASYKVDFTVDKGTEVEVSSAELNADIVYNSVTIKSGKESGKTGLIKVKDLKETGGTKVIKLPTP